MDMLDVLFKILEKISGQKIALVGSFNLQIQGVDIKARDLDFITNLQGIHNIAKIFDSKITKNKQGYFETEFLLDEIEAHFITEDGNNLRNNNLENNIVHIEKNRVSIPCLNIKSELKFYQTSGREKDIGKAKLIEKTLNQNKSVTKVVMFLTRVHCCKRQFLALHRKTDGAYLAPTGHVGDHIEGEALLEAAERELMEEFAVKVINVIDLEYSFEALLKDNILSKEHPFLLEIPDVDVEYLERGDDVEWFALDELKSKLTFKGHKMSAEKIEEYYKSIELL